jgi:hypothetical protein
MPDDTETSIFTWNWRKGLQLAAFGIVEAAMWALIEDFPVWAKLSTVIIGLLFIASLNIALKKWMKLVPWLLVFVYLGLIVYALCFKSAVLPGPASEVRGGCEIKKQARPLHATPMPAQASDGLLMSEALAIEGSLDNLLRLEEYIFRQQMCGASDIDTNHQKCALLQEYESNLRVPAQAVRQAMLDRLPIEGRIPSDATKIITAYSQPRDVEDLSIVMDDLLRLITEFEKKDSVKAESSTKQWIVPVPKGHLPQPPWRECDTTLVQSISDQGYTGQIRSIVSFPHAYSFLVLIKSENPQKNYRRVRLVFREPIDMMSTSRNDDHAQFGEDYIEFSTNSVPFGVSVEIQTRADIRIKGIKFF